jgi:hypothetical protein
LATFYDTLNITPPDFYNGVIQDHLNGVSFADMFDNAEAIIKKNTQYFEVMGSPAHLQLIADELGQPPENLFAAFDPQPFLQHR